MDAALHTRRPAAPSGSPLTAAACTPAEEVLTGLGSGLTAVEASRRQATYGPNAVATHAARLGPVLWQQLRSPLLGLLVAAAAASYFVGERSDAIIICLIVALSVGLGLSNEYRAEKAAEALHSRITHRAVAVRSGQITAVNATELVPGDVVELRLGDIAPADLRLLTADGLECDESVLTGESLPVAKDPAPVPAGSSLAELASCALTGTVVHGGSGRGVVVATGATSQLGRISFGLAGRPVETQFQLGLRRFSMLLPATPLAVPLGFRPFPGAFFGALAGMVVAYLVLIELGKWLFYRLPGPTARRRRHPGRRHLRRRAAYFSTADPAGSGLP